MGNHGLRGLGQLQNLRRCGHAGRVTLPRSEVRVGTRVPRVRRDRLRNCLGLGETDNPCNPCNPWFDKFGQTKIVTSGREI